MHKAPMEMTRHIHENFWIVISFAFARPKIGEVIDEAFKGEWKYLHKTVEYAEPRADRALLEMAVQLRVLDDQHDLSSAFKAQGVPPLGVINLRNGKTRALSFRQMTNKIIHGEYFDWQLEHKAPKVVVTTTEASQDWNSAEINIVNLMAYLGQIMH